MNPTQNFFYPVPPGTYHATFDEAWQIDNILGCGLRWAFRIDAGKYTGTLVCRTTPTFGYPCNDYERFWRMVSGLPDSRASGRDLSEFEGTPGTIVVSRSPYEFGVCVVKFERDDSKRRYTLDELADLFNEYLVEELDDDILTALENLMHEEEHDG